MTRKGQLIALLMGFLALKSVADQLPRTCNIDIRKDQRYVNAEIGELQQFAEKNRGDFLELLFDPSRYQVIVGAKNAMFRLSLDLVKLELVEWEASEESKSLCSAKGRSFDECQSYIKVLQGHRDRLFACSTHAFDPKCSWRDLKDLGRVKEELDGSASCPHSPFANSTSLITSNGDYYFGGAIDFSNNDHVVLKISENGGKVLRTELFNPLWLNQADFVGSFETTNFVYFVFREKAMETSGCGLPTYSRIARVCKNDGGGHVTMKNNWSTFLKARLSCFVPGTPDFHFNEVQDMHYISNEEVLYASFTTPDNSISGTAVCGFNLTSIDKTFNSKFFHRENPNSVWTPKSGNHNHFQCKQTDGNRGTITSKEEQMVHLPVEPSTHGPIFHEKNEVHSHISVDSITSKHNQKLHIIYANVKDSRGLVKKYLFNTETKQTCLVEILKVLGPQEKVNAFKFTKATHSLYVATNKKVIKLPSERCKRYLTRQQCLSSMDPYCGWNRNSDKCLGVASGDGIDNLEQNNIKCPLLNAPVDGGWGPWSDWFPCGLKTSNKGQAYYSSDPVTEDGCFCRRRDCDNPEPQNGGLHCESSLDSMGLEVTNCTRHGGWTTWSEWSACSNSCDVGRRQRKRTCGNPSPAFGGRTCIGRDTDTQFCSDLPPCNSFQPSGHSQLAQKWSEWSGWSRCSAECGPGFMHRERTCIGQDCPRDSCTKDFKECKLKQCTDQVDVTDYTPWIKVNYSGSSRSWSEKRFRFSYRGTASAKDQKIISEDRYCSSPDKCFKTGSQESGSLTSAWSDWSKCSRECGGGYQLKVRYCHPGESGCFGMTVLERPCNTDPCQDGQWSCWSGWSQCDSYGRKSRTRECSGTKVGIHECRNGSGLEEVNCKGEGPQVTPSLGHMSMGSVVGACICGLIAGLGIGGGAVYYYLRFRRHGVHGTPHYLSAKSNNLYVSLPMLDLKQKHLSSDQSEFGTLRSTSTLRSKAGSSIYSGGGGTTDYETATIKRSRSHRNSSLIAGAMRADLDSDQLFT